MSKGCKASPLRKKSTAATIALVVIALISPFYVASASGLSPSSSLAQVGDSEITSSSHFYSANETTVVSLPLQEKDLALILLSAETSKSMRNSIDLIRQRGGEILHIFPTHVLVGRVPRSLRDTLVGKSGIEQIAYSVVDTSIVAKYGENAVVAAEAWNNNFMGQAASKGLEPPTGFVEPPPIKDDMRMAPQPASESSMLPAPPYGAGFYDTSEYMIGDVSVAIILPESNGAIDPNQENWTSSDRSAVISEIQAAMNWWAAREPNAHLSFTYTYAILTTSYEPIRRPYTDEGLWIAEVMADIGYATGDYFYRVRSFLNDLRNGDGTDWAITVFVAHSYWDFDGCFSDGKFAYAYLGGPFIVMTYDNNGYGLANMDAVTAHEFGHSFYALDQYTSAQQPCTKRSGYLNVENQNSAYPSEGSCLSNVSSIMRGQVSPYTSGAIDQYARQQLGWRDSNGNGRLDIVDLYPQNTLYAYSPDPTTNTTPTYSGQASARVCYPNNNPYGQRHDITINTISLVQYWVEDPYGNSVRPTQDATAIDGRFDSDLEGYTFTISSPGTYRFASVAWNSQGLGLIVWDVLTIESPVTVTITKTLTESSTSYLYRTVTTTVTSYTSTTTSTSTIPTVTTVLLVPLTVTSTAQSTQYLTSAATATVTSYTSTQTLTSTIPTTVALIPLTMTSTTQSTQYLTSILTTTVTSYTGTETSTSTIPTTVALVPLTMTSTAQSTQSLTSTLTTTATSYTGTQTSTITIVVPTTIVLVPSTVTSTVQSTQYLTSTATTTVTSYTATTTSTSTSVVYTTVTTTGTGGGGSSPLAYLGFVSLLAITVGRVATRRVWKISKVRLLMERTCSKS